MDHLSDSPESGHADSSCSEQQETETQKENNDGQQSNAKTPDGLGELLDHFVNSTEGQDKVRIADLLESLNSRAHGPMLLLPAIIAISPIGMIPGMSVVTGTLIILIATQMMLFSSRPWIPKRLEAFEFSRAKLKSGVRKTQPWVKRFEKLVRKRWQVLTYGPAIFPLAIVCIVLAILFYPLAFVPLGVFVPGLAVTTFALGLTARDGVLVAAGYGFTIAAVAIIWVAWPF